MALKTLRYTINADGVSPNYERKAGTQYDHKKTALQFTLDTEFYDEIMAVVGDGSLHYRFDCYDGEGNVHLGVLNQIDGTSLIPYELEYWVTKFGGKPKVNLVITITNNEATTKEWSYEVVLYLDDLPETDIDNNNKYQSMSTLANNTANCFKKVDERYEKILLLYNELSDLEDMLKNGEWIFDGESGADIVVQFVVDNKFSIDSNNPVANKVITERLNRMDDSINAFNHDIEQMVYDSIAKKIRDDIFDKVYPIGSYYWSSEPTNPELLFSGIWQQVKDVFILASGDKYSANSTGGEAEHKLLEKEMPQHNHMFKPNAGGIVGTDFFVPTKISGNGISSIAERGKVSSPAERASYVWGTTTKGGNQAHNNMPPYITAYCWKRIG